MEPGVEAADQLRAAVMDKFTSLSLKQRESEAASAIQPRRALVRPAMGKPTDNPLGITFASTGNLEAPRCG